MKKQKVKLTIGMLELNLKQRIFDDYKTEKINFDECKKLINNFSNDK